MARLAQVVFKGGGVKGIGLVGALAVAEELGWRWKAVAGTSAGSITAALVGAGYRAPEVHKVLFDLDFRKFEDGGGLKTVNLLLHEGIYKGQYVIDLMDQLLGSKLGKQVVTFRDLPVATRVVASDLTHKRMLVFPDDLAGAPYHLPDPLSFPVAHAVRASVSIPFFFEPYRLTLPNGIQATLVDGGLLSNFPVHLFEPRGKPPLVPTFGFDLIAPNDDQPVPTKTPLQLVEAMVDTLLGGRDRADLEHQNYARAIYIDTGTYKTTQFDIDAAGKDWLYQSGRRAAEAFFADPETDAWLKRFPYRMAPGTQSAAGREPER
ncbi:MAG: patatin-like phospholipase family protein [Bacillota bacterium]